MAWPYLWYLPVLPAKAWKTCVTVPLFTGYTRDGGFATHAIADARYVFPLGEGDDDIAIAPLLCAGLIGWRSLVMAGEAERLGLYGFGAAGHIVAQIARWQGRRRLWRSHAEATQLRRIWRASWVRYGPVRRMNCRMNRSMQRSSTHRPESWSPLALRAVRKGGRVVCAGIHMSDIPSFPIRLVVGGTKACLRGQSDPSGRTWTS